METRQVQKTLDAGPRPDILLVLLEEPAHGNLGGAIVVLSLRHLEVILHTVRVCDDKRLVEKNEGEKEKEDKRCKKGKKGVRVIKLNIRHKIDLMISFTTLL